MAIFLLLWVLGTHILSLLQVAPLVTILSPFSISTKALISLCPLFVMWVYYFSSLLHFFYWIRQVSEETLLFLKIIPPTSLVLSCIKLSIQFLQSKIKQGLQESYSFHCKGIQTSWRAIDSATERWVYLFIQQMFIVHLHCIKCYSRHFFMELISYRGKWQREIYWGEGRGVSQAEGTAVMYLSSSITFFEYFQGQVQINVVIESNMLWKDT